MFRLTGATAVSADRKGKYLLCPLDTGDVLMVHLRMSGQLLIDRVATERPRHTHVALRLADGNELRFVDPRTFGEVVVFDPTAEPTTVPDLMALGPDPIAEELSLAALRRLLKSTRRAVKAVLLDQHVVAGIGNIYGDEILHRSGISPLRPADRISYAQSSRLHDAIHSVLTEAIEAGGSTLADSQYVDLMGDEGSFQQSHRVYGRSGQMCLSCGRGRVVSRVVGGRTTSWCRVCQR
ncbi:MAG: formamidopyrimidine-DNA glycosylase/DNA-(apurinic or apyrimidinic site) lyase [Actinomycetota bacterium]|jgi:formamidopyrimidine-DNA glycosylase